MFPRLSHAVISTFTARRGEDGFAVGGRDYCLSDNAELADVRGK